MHSSRLAAEQGGRHGLQLAALVWLYLALYVVGMVAGLLANMALDVQLRVPGLREALGLILFALVLWGILSATHTPFTDVLKPTVWLGTGGLVGIGSKKVVRRA